MQVTLFRALRSVNIDDETASKVVDAIEEHVDMAVGQANKTLEAKIDAMQLNMETTMKSGLDGMKTSIDGIRWWIIGVGSVLVATAIAGGVLTSVAAFLK